MPGNHCLKCLWRCSCLAHWAQFAVFTADASDALSDGRGDEDVINKAIMCKLAYEQNMRKGLSEANDEP